MQSENEYDIDFCVDEDGSFAPTYVMKRDMKKVYEIAINCNDFRFLEMFMRRLMWMVRKEVPPNIRDMRNRDEEDKFDRCFFHCHGKEVDCRAVNGASDSFLRKSDMNKA